MICVFFFFSSRRRHTRYIGDWSSDVCSSDLISLSSAKSREAWYPPSRDFAELSDIEGVRQVEAVEWTPLPGHERAGYSWSATLMREATNVLAAAFNCPTATSR